MTSIPNMPVPRVQITAGAFAGLFADVLQARIVADDGTALLLRAVDAGDVWELVLDAADVAIIDDVGSEREAA